MSFQFGDVLDNPAGSRNLYPITLKSYDPNTRTWDFAWADGDTCRVSESALSALVKISSAEPAAFQVGDVVEITKPDLWDYAVNAWPRAENRWTVEEVFPGVDFRIRNAFGNLCVGGFEIRKIASSKPTPQCNCSARDLAWIGHTCGLANSDPWRALAGVFE